MIGGLHHVTAMAGDAQTNVEFYAGVLGLRLVKKTVNFDDPGTYHLYYGDGLGRPGTIITFFPWPNARRGRIGTGQVAVTTFAVPTGSLAFWHERLAANGVSVTEESGGLRFSDPDGLGLEMRETDPYGDGSGSGTVPAEYAIRGIAGVTLWVPKRDATATMLTDVMGWSQREQGVFGPQQEAENARVSVVGADEREELPRGAMGVGVVHHVAFRVADDATEQEWLRKLQALGFSVSPVMDRQYFHSIYFREPGGVLFEIATNPPGFTADESPESLGTHLKLPEWLESHRTSIEGALPALRVPGAKELVR
jgi:glyoxalase family protein